jgi:hypothetical protein
MGGPAAGEPTEGGFRGIHAKRIVENPLSTFTK